MSRFVLQIRSEGQLDESISTSLSTVNAPSLKHESGDIAGASSAVAGAGTNAGVVAAALDASEERKVHNRKVINKTTGQVSVRPTVVSTSTSSASTGPEEHADPLDKSLSSAFFQNLRKSSDKLTPSKVSKTLNICLF